MKVAGITLALATAALAQNSSLPTLQQALQNTSSLSMLYNLSSSYLASIASANPGGNITLFAPNNAAVSKFLNSSMAAAASNPDLIQALLSYHVVQGNYTNVTNSSFLATDLMMGNYAQVSGGQRVEAVVSDGSFSLISGLLQNTTINGSAIQTQNGVVHIVNSFLTLPQNITTSLVALNLTSAVGALQATNLTSTLASQSDLTYFIPNNAAFQAIGGTLTNLSMSNMTAVASVLEYHVVKGSMPLYSTELMNGTMETTLEGANVTVRIMDGDVYVNNAKVVVPNVLVSNGVVHVIDRVLNPMNTTLTPASSTVQDFAGATSASNVPFTSGVPTPSSTIATQSAPNAQASKASSSGAAWQPAVTGALNMGALFGGAALVMNM